MAESDFKTAESMLPAAWDPANLGRATSGAAAGFLPGLAWQRYDWPGVAILALAALSLGTLALCVRSTSRPS